MFFYFYLMVTPCIMFYFIEILFGPVHRQVELIERAVFLHQDDDVFRIHIGASQTTKLSHCRPMQY